MAQTNTGTVHTEPEQNGLHHVHNTDSLRSFLGTQILFFDGGTGSVLQTEGLQPGEFPETWNIIHPDRIIDLHYQYYKAGANIGKTNTFGAYTAKFPLQEAAHSSAVSRAVKTAEAKFCLENVVQAAVENAQQARAKIEAEDCEQAHQPHFIAFDIGPCGKLLKPMGDLDFEDAVTLFKQTLRAGLGCGIDAVLIETMNDCYETKAAVLAVQEVKEELAHSNPSCGDFYRTLPVFATTVYDENGKLLTGADPETMTAVLEGLGIDALGMNCSLGPVQMKGLVPRFAASSSVPVIVNPNAGLPRSEDGQTVYDVDEVQFAAVMKEIADAGAALLGGCCGTTPDYIRRLVQTVGYRTLAPKVQNCSTVIASYTHTVTIGGCNPPVIIGERINPTGKKNFKQALRDGNITYIVQQGIAQEEQGAQVLDVNVGLPEINEKDMMVRVVQELQAVTDLPLQIDTSSPDVMEASLRRYNGKALVNSVNGRPEIMHVVFPLVKKYGGVVVALTIDENGIPATADGRMEIVRKLYAVAASYGIKKKDIIIDPLAMAVSSDDRAPEATLETVRRVHSEGGKTILGVSNVSFGLPERDLVTSAFFIMACQNGLNAAIMNPASQEMMRAYTTFCLLSGKDALCRRYIDFAAKYATLRAAPAVSSSTPETLSGGHVNPDKDTLVYAVIHGLKEEAASCTARMLQTDNPLDIINRSLIPALDIVGKGFEAKTVYLPQLLMSAESAKSSFSVIKEELARTGTQGKSRGSIIIATVQGDIHDIGKNIVKVLLENYDFTVIDLGKDVAPQIIVERCIKDHIRLVGLSALMTTTVPAMEETIQLLRKQAPWAKVCVGGAVMTKEYAEMIGADFYGKDAMDTVKYAQTVFA